MLIHFAAHKHHLGLYPGEETIIEFSEQLTDYKTSKGAVQLPWSKQLPESLIRDMVQFSLLQI